MTVQDWLGPTNQLGIDIWSKKYRFEDETFDEWLNRVSGNNSELKDLILNKKFLFGGRILSNRGLERRGRKITLSNCYVIQPPEDNIESIYEAAAKLARTYSYGGGCGIDISNLAPEGAKVNNAANETSGAVSFMDTYSQVTAQIGQNGRRGALMISLDCHHPDLEKFIDIKTDLNKVTKANISIRFTDDFMEAVKHNTEFTLSFVRPETGETIEKTVNARSVFMKLAKNNWNFAEPGCLFWDNISNYNLLANTEEFSYAGTNPCAEEPLPEGGSCLLGSLNLSAFIETSADNKPFFNFDEFENAVEIAVEALNTVLEEGLPLHPLKEQRESVKTWKQIGLGIMGLADMLIKLGIRYGSDAAIELCDKIGQVMAETALATSSHLAELKGTFEKCNMEDIAGTEYFAANIKTPEVYQYIIKNGLRNSQLLTIAPTGSISTMLGISGGIEPIFANYYTRKTESLHNDTVYYKVYTPIVQKYLDEHTDIDDEHLPEYFVTAADIHYLDRLNMQAVWQKHIDASISSTVNVPNGFTIQDTFDLYLKAWELGLKGVTIYRDGCKRDAVLSAAADQGASTEDSGGDIPSLARGQIIPANDNNLIGLKRKLTTGCGSLHCEAYFDPDTNELREIFLSKGSTGGCLNSLTGISRLISVAVRGGVSLDAIIDQLMSTGSCPSYTARAQNKHDTSKGSCCPMAVGYALKDMQEQFIRMNSRLVQNGTIQMEELNPEDALTFSVAPKCPNCGEPLYFEGGCNICKACGWTKCD